MGAPVQCWDMVRAQLMKAMREAPEEDCLETAPFGWSLGEEKE